MVNPSKPEIRRGKAPSCSPLGAPSTGKNELTGRSTANAQRLCERGQAKVLPEREDGGRKNRRRVGIQPAGLSERRLSAAAPTESRNQRGYQRIGLERDVFGPSGDDERGRGGGHE